MKSDEWNRKLRHIAKAIAEGRSCEQILAQDPALTYHDIFRAVSEVPTSYWKKEPASGTKPPGLPGTKPPPAPVRHRVD